MTKICAIHQPNFFPWLGYFDKIKDADIFVFLDNVQNIKTGSNWVNRVKLNYNNTEKWFTCPIKRPSGLTSINAVEFSNDNWDADFLSVLWNYYRLHVGFKKTINLIENILAEKNSNLLADFNIIAIRQITDYLGIQSCFIKQSELNVTGNSTELLINICKQVKADTYLCGNGASSYQNDNLFVVENIELKYQDFKILPYGDDGSKFLPGLSVIDYLMNIK